MRRILAAALAVALLVPGAALGSHATNVRVDAALGWLAAQQALDGRVGSDAESAWAAIAFARGGRDPDTIAVPGGASLEAAVVAATRPTLDANGLARQVLALVASGADPRTAAGFDAVAALLATYDGAQFGNPNLVNDDVFALQALTAAGVPPSDPAVQGGRAFLLSQQLPVGAWSYGTVSPTNPDVLFAVTSADVDTTGQAIVALLVTGGAAEDLPIQRALLWIKLNQGLDGGCTWSLPMDVIFDAAFDPTHLGQSNADSTSWAIMGIRTAGEDPDGASWTTVTGASLVDFLESLQMPSGQVLYQPAATGFFPVQTTAHAAIAMSGHNFVA